MPCRWCEEVSSVRMRAGLTTTLLLLSLSLTHFSMPVRALMLRPALLGRHGKSLRSLSASSTLREQGSSIPQNFDSQFMNVMLERGFLHQCTNFAFLDKNLRTRTCVAYLGFDATASSLHVGSLLQIMILRKLQQCGHKPIVLVGGGTTLVGDPTGKDESRQLLSTETINANMNSLSKVFSKFITFGDGPTDAIMVNNADWLCPLKYLEFLRDYGRFFTINRMLSFESVKQRLAREQPLTFLEFNYMLLQAFDFVELNRRYGATIQLGGSDQWGNIVSGVELGRKMGIKDSLLGLTAPLITTSDGRKMGKTSAGAVWLNKDMLSEYDYWQFWRSTADSDVVRFLKLFTDLPMSVIAEYEQLQGHELNRAKRLLADECTRLLHGEASLPEIHTTVDNLFSAASGGGLDSLPKVVLQVQDVAHGTISVVELFVRSGLCATKSEAKRLIRGGGAKVADYKVEDEHATVGRDSFDSAGKLKLALGKKKFALALWPAT